jgi:hypothetical protein
MSAELNGAGAGLHPVGIIDGPFPGRSILDLEALRVMAEDELATIERTYPDSPGIAGLQYHLASGTEEICQRGHMGGRYDR